MTPSTDSTDIAELCRLFLEQHEASPARMELLAAMLRLVGEAFGDRTYDELSARDIAFWRADLPPPTRWQATQAFAQVTSWAARWGLIAFDPLQTVRNPRPTPREFTPLASWVQVEVIARALPAGLELLPWLGAGCGLRPGELLGLDWECIDLERREVVVRASAWRGELRSSLKTRRSRRVVPLRDRVADAIDAVDVSQRHGLVFATRHGTPLDLHNVRGRAWRPALRRAGIEHPHRIYDLRHTYATWSLRAGVSIFQLARRMGTSVDMIDSTYGHLAADAGEHERRLLDAWDEQ